MLPYVFNFSTINSLDCETFHKVRNNVQIVNFDLEQELWMQEGACVFADPDLFFPVGSSMKALKQAAEAKAICNECDVKLDCLEYAIRTNQDSGVWGGTTEDERKSIRREYKKTGTVSYTHLRAHET